MSDLIDRQAAIHALESEKTYSTIYKDGYTWTDYFKQYNAGLTDGIKALNNLPSAQPTVDIPERNVGKWIFYERREPQYDLVGTKTWANAYRCSECGFIHTVIEDFGHYAFCPRCGAYMGEETEDAVH